MGTAPRRSLVRENLDSPTPFYAPMAALLVVDRTMVRSIGASARRVAAVILGMSIAWLVGSLVGVTWWSMVPVMMAALLIARWPLLGDHGIQVPTMALLSLLTVKGTDTDFTYLTIVDAADEAARHPAPSARWLEDCAGVLVGARTAGEQLRRVGPTDTGPIRTPLAETVPAVAQLQQQIEQVPLVGEPLPPIIEQVSGRPPEPAPPRPPPPPADGEGSAPRS